MPDPKKAKEEEEAPKAKKVKEVPEFIEKQVDATTKIRVPNPDFKEKADA